MQWKARLDELRSSSAQHKQDVLEKKYRESLAQLEVKFKAQLEQEKQAERMVFERTIEKEKRILQTELETQKHSYEAEKEHIERKKLKDIRSKLSVVEKGLRVLSGGTDERSLLQSAFENNCNELSLHDERSLLRNSLLKSLKNVEKLRSKMQLLQKIEPYTDFACNTIFFIIRLKMIK